MRRAFLLTLLTAGLGGCGSLGNDGTPDRDDGVDREKMAQIEQAASHSGARVHWVNPPLKRTK